MSPEQILVFLCVYVGGGVQSRCVYQCILHIIDIVLVLKIWLPFLALSTLYWCSFRMHNILACLAKSDLVIFLIVWHASREWLSQSVLMFKDESISFEKDLTAASSSSNALIERPISLAPLLMWELVSACLISISNCGQSISLILLIKYR